MEPAQEIGPREGNRNGGVSHPHQSSEINETCCQNHQDADFQEESGDLEENYDPEAEALQRFRGDLEELNHFKSVVAAFYNYEIDSFKDVERTKKNFSSLGEQMKLLKYNYEEKIERIKHCIGYNYGLLLNLVCEQQALMKIQTLPSGHLFIPPFNTSYRDISKLRSTLRQFVREWSEEGRAEREMCFLPIKEEFHKYFPKPEKTDGTTVRVLFPGAGMGRLPFDFAAEGYASQGNEFSYFMLIASEFILNNVQKAKQFVIFPYVHSLCNVVNAEDPFQKFEIPDVNPLDVIKPGTDFSMVAGEFVEVYTSQKEEWDSIVTCFFIDTANNIIDYINTIYNCLTKGGVWINFGPLLYHYAEMEGERSIELSWEELRYIVETVGFEIKQESIKEAHYTSNPKSMMKTVYNCIFFTAVKK